MPTLISFLSFVFVIVSSNGTHNTTTDPNAVTFHTIARDYYGTTTLYAHEGYAGASFYELEVGDVITLSYPDEVDRFVVTDIDLYHATDPLSIYSYFIDLDSGDTYSSLELGKLIYDNNDLTLQTCYGVDGRYFVMAERLGFVREKDVR